MCKIYNEIGSLTVINSHLINNDITDFKSLNEIIDFKNTYVKLRQEIISFHTTLISQEKKELNEEIIHLNNKLAFKKDEFKAHLRQKIENLRSQFINLSSAKTISSLALNQAFMKVSLKIEIWMRELFLNLNVNMAVKHLKRFLAKKTKRYQYLETFFDEAVTKSSLPQTLGLDKKWTAINEIRSCIYGALGEQRVVKELETLNDDFILINDYCCIFNPPLYNNREKDYIKSIQIDHILIAPSGVFIIETKNWSEQSQNDINLRSPVKQIKRTNFALFKMLASEKAYSDLMLKQHHWGDKKIPLRNLIVLINSQPNAEFQYVKILKPNRLLSYINYFKPSFSITETQAIAKYLLNRQSNR